MRTGTWDIKSRRNSVCAKGEWQLKGKPSADFDQRLLTRQSHIISGEGGGEESHGAPIARPVCQNDSHGTVTARPRSNCECLGGREGEA